jgi:hypothetical protein
MKMRSSLVAAALLCLAVPLPGSNALAQQKQQVSFTVPGENSKYVISQNVDVDDAPNHILRLFDVTTQFLIIPRASTGISLSRLSPVALAT